MTGYSSPPAQQRRLGLHMRPDLLIRPLHLGGRRYWSVKDPVSLRYFQFGDEEYCILKALDGRTSAEEIKMQFERRFAPRKLDLQQFHGFLGVLHRQGLIIADAAGQGEQLLRRRAEQRRWALASTLANVLAIRLRGVDPEPLLRWLHPKCRWMFSRWCFLLWLALALSALTLIVAQFDALRASLPDFQAFFSVRNVVWLAAAMALSKVLHELGHGLACRHFGGECHELGLMLLVFTPCLYCNVSDSWMLASKWRRAAIGAAGMYVEIGLASLCAWLWRFSEPGLFNALCLNMMVVCSLSTLVFNGNPLLRFDGYFILSDLTETPNLQQRSAAVVQGWLKRRVLGVERGAAAAAERRPGLLALYAVASTSYRWLVVAGILWFCLRLLKPLKLEAAAHVLTLAVVLGLAAPPLWRVIRFLRDPSIRRQVSGPRLSAWVGLAAAVAAAVCLIPLPHRVSAPLLLQPRHARRVYVSVPGVLRQAVRVGELVPAGGMLAQLENYELRREIAKLSGARDLQQLRLENLQRRRIVEPLLGDQIPVAQEALQDLEKRLHQRRRDLQRLTLSAPIAGAVLPPPPRDVQTPGDALQDWSGIPLEPHNHGALLETGTLLCLIGDPSQVEAVAVIDQAQIEFVRSGQAVRIRADQLPGRVLHGVVEELSELHLDAAPLELVAAGLLPAQEDASGVRRPLRTSYLARVRLDEHDAPLLLGSPGRAKIDVPPRSLAARMRRSVRSVFRLDL